MRLVVSLALTLRVRSTMNADSARISRTFPNSDGWKVKNGNSIQRREPRAAVPIARTRTINPISAA